MIKKRTWYLTVNVTNPTRETKMTETTIHLPDTCSPTVNAGFTSPYPHILRIISKYDSTDTLSQFHHFSILFYYSSFPIYC